MKMTCTRNVASDAEAVASEPSTHRSSPRSSRDAMCSCARSAWIVAMCAWIVTACTTSTPVLTTDKSRGLDVHEKQCVALVERNELKRAESNCRLCLEFEERHANCLNAYGVIHLANGDDDAA